MDSRLQVFQMQVSGVDFWLQVFWLAFLRGVSGWVEGTSSVDVENWSCG